MIHFNDPLCMPFTGEGAAERFDRATALAGTAGEEYARKRGIPAEVARAADLRFDPDLAGRAAVLFALRDSCGRLTALHGRYLQVRRGDDKMLTFGAPGGVIELLGGLQAERAILVEGLFDALSLAACGWPCVATIGRWAPWLAGIWSGRTVWLGFDAGRPGEGEVARYSRRLSASRVRRLLPPPRCKDWNTALVKRGAGVVARWVRDAVARDGETG